MDNKNSSDLAVEAGSFEGLGEDVFSEKRKNGLLITKTHIATEENAVKYGRRRGRYATVADSVPITESGKERHILKAVSAEFAEILKSEGVAEGKILVVGLGNYGMTADALGGAVLKRLKVGAGKYFEVCALAPSVSALTGLESFDVVAGVSGRIKPSAIVAIDALSTNSAKRLCSCFQISSAGIRPGSGVDNPKAMLSEEALGVKVIGVGVPFIAKGLMEGGLLVTLKDVDAALALSAEIIAGALNLYFFGKI